MNCVRKEVFISNDFRKSLTFFDVEIQAENFFKMFHYAAHSGLNFFFKSSIYGSRIFEKNLNRTVPKRIGVQGRAHDERIKKKS